MGGLDGHTDVRIISGDGRSRPIYVRRRGSSSTASNPARWRRGAMVQMVSSGGSTRWRRGGMRKEFENGAETYPVHVRLWAEEVRRGWFGVSGEALPGPRTWGASWASSKANQIASADWKWLEWASRGGRGSGGLEGGGASCSRRSPANSGLGRT
jgi:hypothetical protein